MAEINDSIIKATQDSLGKLIKKPVLTDKLLRKPPFKFLHDIISAVIKTTGYLNGLYSDDELQSDNIKDRDSKIAFLQKAIDAIKLSTKQDIKARPSKIVAGLEADKTNELLQVIARAIDQKIDSTDAVAAVKSGKTVSKAAKESKQAKTLSKVDSKDSKTGKEVTVTKRTKIESNQVKHGERKKSTVPTSNANKVAAVKQARKSSIDNGDDKKLKKKPSVSKEKPAKETVAPKVVKKEVSKETIETVESKAIEQPNIVNDNKNVEPEIEIKRSDSPTETEANLNNQPSTESLPSAQAPTEIPIVENTPKSSVEKSQKPTNDKPRSSKIKKDDNNLESNAIEKHNDSNGGDRFSKSKSFNEKEKEKEKENDKPQNDIASKMSNDASKTRPGSTLRSAALRPVSARPSAPRRRDRNVRQILHTENFIQDPNKDSDNAEKKNFPTEFDDADNIIITNVIQDNITSLDISDSNKENGEHDGKQGHLVQQILETQSTMLKADSKDDATALISDENLMNERKSIARNMTELRKSIQKLSLYITPLGKMMEYFQEDVDAMQIELLMWQKAYTTAEADIKEEKRQTEELLEQFKYHLAEVNNNIKEHTEQINNATMNIIQNEEKISKLIITL